MAIKVSRLASELLPDSPLVQDAAYQLDAADRQWIDARQRAAEIHLSESLLNGVHASWYTVDPSTSALATGSVVATSVAARGTVVLATAAALAAGSVILGIALRAASPGAKVQVAHGGLLSPSITGLAASAGFARASATGLVERVGSLSAGDTALGTVDPGGWLSLQPLSAGLTVGGLATSVAAVAGTVPERGSSAEIYAAYFAAVETGIAASGLIRATDAAQVVVAQLNGAGTHDVDGLSFDGSDGVQVGGTYSATTRLISGLANVEIAAATSVSVIGATVAQLVGGAASFTLDNSTLAFAIDCGGDARVDGADGAGIQITGGASLAATGDTVEVEALSSSATITAGGASVTLAPTSASPAHVTIAGLSASALVGDGIALQIGVVGGFSQTHAQATAGFTPSNETWKAQDAFTGDAESGGGFHFEVGFQGDVTSNYAGDFEVDLGPLKTGSASRSGSQVWLSDGTEKGRLYATATVLRLLSSDRLALGDASSASVFLTDGAGGVTVTGSTNVLVEGAAVAIKAASLAYNGLTASSGGVTAKGEINLCRSSGTPVITCNGGAEDSGTLGFFNSAGTTKPTITGSRGSNAALADLLTKLASLGLIVDSSS